MPKRISTKAIKKSAKRVGRVVGHDIGRDVIPVPVGTFPPDAPLKVVFPPLKRRSKVGVVREEYTADLFWTHDGQYVIAQRKTTGMSSSSPLKASSQTKQGIIDEVIDYATEVIGSQEKAMFWLGNEILGQMEHGIW